MSKQTAAYIAGFIDGEGYIGIITDKNRINFRRNDSYKTVLKIANTNKDIIQWFKNSFGGYLEHRTMKENQKDAYCWTIEGKNLQPFLDKVSPYLRIKKKQAEIIKDFRKTYNEGSYEYIQRIAKNGGHLTSKTTKPEVLELREKLYQQIRELNKRGTCAR